MVAKCLVLVGEVDEQRGVEPMIAVVVVINRE